MVPRQGTQAAHTMGVQMSQDFDPREAGRSIVTAFNFLKQTNSEIAQLLQTLGKLFGEADPPWEAQEPTVTWYNSATIDNPARWIPRFFIRVWRKRSDGKNWKRAVAVHIALDALFDRDLDEPRIGCYLLDALREEGIQTWQTWWLTDFRRQLDARFPHGLERQAMEWSEPRDPNSMPVRMCGFWLNLTDLRSEEELRRMIVEPLLKLEAGWELSKLPPLPAS